MIEELATAIVAKWTSTDGDTARTLCGETDDVKKFWFERAPQGAVPPYVVFSVPSADLEQTMSDDFPGVLVQFSVYSDDSATLEAAQIVEAIRALYNRKHLTMGSDWKMLRADPVTPGRVLADPDIGWQGIVEFRFRLAQGK